MSNPSPIKVFITGAANGLAEVREGLADHPEVELVGTAADPAKAGGKLAESAAQVILHGTTATDHVPTAEIEAIRAVTAAPIVLVTSASAHHILSEALQAGIFDVVLLPQLTDSVVFTIKKASSLAAGRSGGAPGKASQHVEGKVVTVFAPKGGAGKTVLASQPRGRLRPQAGAPHAPARPGSPVRRRGDHDGHRAREDDLRPRHGPARARPRRSGGLRHRAPVRRARPPGAASPRGCRARDRGAPRPPVRRRQGELRRRSSSTRRRSSTARCSRRSTAPTSSCSSRRSTCRRSRTSSSRSRRSTSCTTRRSAATCC